jgi:hypothetical protein
VAYPFGAFLAQPAGRFHPTLSANSRRQSARRAGLKLGQAETWPQSRQVAALTMLSQIHVVPRGHYG